MLRNEIIPSKESSHFLGMTRDSRLNWEEHINKLRAKAKRALNTIKVVTGKKWGGNWKTLKNCTVQYVEKNRLWLPNIKYRFVELNAGHREQQKKSLNTKSDVRHTNRAPKPGKTAHTM